jgi:hypothetical protein
MEHAEIQGKLSAYLDNAVSTEEKAEIKKHLGICGSCRVAIADLELTVGYIKSLPEIEPPPWLTSKIMAIVRDETIRNPSLWRRIFLPLHVKLPIEVVALVFLCITGYYITRTISMPTQLTAPISIQKRNLPQPSTTKAPTAASSAQSSEMGKKMAPVTDTLSQPAKPPSPNSDQQEEESPPAPALPSRPMHEPELRPADDVFITEKGVEHPLGKEENGASHKAIHRSRKSPESSLAPAAGAPETMAAGKEEVFLAVDDPIAAAGAIEEAVTRVGGTINGHSYSEDNHILFVRIGAQKMPGLLERLDRIGKLQERPNLPASASGKIELIIRW